MGKAQTVKIGPHEEYEAEVLTGITEAAALAYAEYKIADYRTGRWKLDEDEQRYILPTAKDQRDYVFFDRAYFHLKAILAADKNTVFETVGDLLDLLRGDPGGFEKVYKAAIAANPDLDQRPVEAPKEGEPNPLA